MIYIYILNFTDVALDLVRCFPHLVTLKLENGDSLLKAMARKSSAFPSGTPLSLWQRILYSCKFSQPLLYIRNYIYFTPLKFVHFCNFIHEVHFASYTSLKFTLVLTLVQNSTRGYVLIRKMPYITLIFKPH